MGWWRKKIINSSVYPPPKKINSLSLPLPENNYFDLFLSIYHFWQGGGVRGGYLIYS
jgi:hypothetical protein